MEKFDEIIQEEFIDLSKSLEKTNDLFSNPKDRKITKERLAQFIFNYYTSLTKSNYHVTQAFETAQRYTMGPLTPLFSGSKIPINENENNAISDLESLKLNDDEIKLLVQVEGQKNLLTYIDQISTVDPESFLIYQLYARYISRLIAPFWKKHIEGFIKETKSTFSLVQNYTNLNRNEFLYGFGSLNRVIKEESRAKVLENLSLSSKLIENYLNEMNCPKVKTIKERKKPMERPSPQFTPVV
jgi:hypothetical protein